MAKTSTLTVRLAPELLEALEARAKRLGRSTSAEVVRLLSREMVVTTRAAKATRPRMRMFSQLEAPDVEDFAASRKAISKTIPRSVRASSEAL
ncbi:MAG: ribbon-helix-helix protein, CopG family [Proteobacteria bacterium]|nr:MAG: ribbon-helix-helix protein, CopG family [Pseudomonadota bacterium]